MTSSEDDHPSLYLLLAENEELRNKNKELEAKLAESEQTLNAIHGGEVDAFIISTDEGEKIYTLKGADEPYRVLFEQMNEGAVTISEDGGILYRNRSFAKAMGASLDKVIGTNFETFICPSEIAGFRELLGRSIDGPSREEIIFKASDGTSVPMQLSINFLSTSRAPVFCMVATD